MVIPVKRKIPEKPFECAYCSGYFVSSHYFIMTLKTGEQFGICDKCRLDLSCETCAKKIPSSELYLEECPLCEKISIVCQKCRKAKKTFLERIKDIIKRFLYSSGLCGISIQSDQYMCCLKKENMPLRFSGIIYVKKGAKENTGDS